MRDLLANISLKALSVALAVLLWFFIAGEKTSERGLSVPVELQNFPRDLELTGELVNTVEVRLRASPGIIHALGPEEISAQVDLAGAGEGERIVHLTPDSIRAPFGVNVVKITPTILTLNFERTVEKAVPIRPRLLGRPAPGFEVAEVVSEPAETRIAGPRSRVQEVESAFTEPLSVEGAKEPVVNSVNIGLEDPFLRLQGAPRARVTARVREVHERRVFDGLRVGVRGGTAQVRPVVVRVVLTGPVSQLREVGPEDVRPHVGLEDGQEGTRRRAVSVEIAPGHPGVALEAVEPAEVTVRPLRKER
jgi:YbbR domain-containing protein